MRKPLVLLTILMLGLVAGCAAPPPSSTPTPAPTLPPSPTPLPAPTTAAPPVNPTPAGPASCVVEPLDFPVETRIPPVTEKDHAVGPADAAITFIEYADFQ